MTESSAKTFQWKYEANIKNNCCLEGRKYGELATPAHHTDAMPRTRSESRYRESQHTDTL